MIFLFIILPILLVVSLVSLVVRTLFGGGRFRHRHPRGNWINGTGYGTPYGYNRGNGFGGPFGNTNRFGYRRRSGLGGSLVSILALVALERLFTRRW